jgi:hypothetical protein
MMEELTMQARHQARREWIIRIARQLEELGEYDKFISPEG